VVEIITEGLNQGFSRQDLIKHEQIVPLVEKQMDLYISICGTGKLGSVEAVVDDVLKRHQQAQSKMKIIHPPTPQITLTYA
jgi:hypothetical protein